MGGQEQDEWEEEQGLADEDLRAIDDAIESATKKRRSDDFVESSNPQRSRSRRLPRSIVALQHPNPNPLSRCEMRLSVMKFGGRILYSKTAIDVEQAANHLLHTIANSKSKKTQFVLGFDIEWRPSFTKEENGLIRGFHVGPVNFVSVRISHLLFANDAILFGDVSREQLLSIRWVVDNPLKILYPELYECLDNKEACISKVLCLQEEGGNVRVSDLRFYRDFQDWELDVVYSLLDFIQACIPRGVGSDTLCWCLKGNGKFDTRSFYHEIQDIPNSLFPWKGVALWQIGVVCAVVMGNLWTIDFFIVLSQEMAADEAEPYELISAVLSDCADILKESVSPGKAAVMQICGDTSHCHVMHIFHSGIPKSLQLLLEDPTLLKVGAGIANDAVKVFKDYNVSIKAVEDLSYLAKQKLGGGPHQWGLGPLTKKLISKELRKPNKIKLGNWETNFLSKEQLDYAATDAFASWYLYQVLEGLPNLEVAACQGSEKLEGVTSE
uniref:3'-5' exonuclease n=1 Tax=Quercus lobata TaxID=97700 RepID=A0A7N2R6G2_QUELO